MLEKVYLGITGKELNEVIDKIVSSDNKHNRHKASWNIVNEVSGRKKARTAKLKGKNVKGRLGSWPALYSFHSVICHHARTDMQDHTSKNKSYHSITIKLHLVVPVECMCFVSSLLHALSVICLNNIVYSLC